MAGISWIASRSFAMTGGLGRDGAGINWIASRSFAMAGAVIAMTGGVIASGSDAIQLVVQEEAGLPRRFAPRNDGWAWERRSWHQLDRFTFVRDDGGRHCERERRNPAGGWRVASRVVIASLRSNPASDWRGVVGSGETELASTGSLHVRSR
jgi:hypothetical protein